MTTWQFDPHSPSTQWTVCWDNLPLWHSDTCTIHPGIFSPSQLQGGWFVTCDMTSTLLKMLSDIMSTMAIHWNRNNLLKIYVTYSWNQNVFVQGCHIIWIKKGFAEPLNWIQRQHMLLWHMLSCQQGLFECDVNRGIWFILKTGKKVWISYICNGR